MSAKLFKVGDKVRIKSNVQGGYQSNNCEFVYDMEKYKNSILTISEITARKTRYCIEEDDGRWFWDDGFLEPAKKNIFAESNAILLANGEVRLVHEDRLYLPNGTSIGIENYNERKHNFDSNFDVVEVHEKATGNYLFELSGKLIEEE